MRKLQPERKGHLAFWLLGIVAILLGSVTAWTVLLFRADAGWVDHSHEVLLAISNLEVALTQAESSMRAYFVNSDETYVKEFELKRAEAQRQVKRLYGLVADTPGQARTVGELSGLVSQRITKLAEVYAERKAGASLEAIRAGHGAEIRGVIAGLNKLTSSLRTEEEGILYDRRSQRRRTEALIFALCAIGAAVSIGLVYAGQRAIQNYRSMRDQTQNELEAINAGLDERVRLRTKELTMLTAALSRSNVELESFAYAATHDLQEPLRSITVFAQLLQRRIGESSDAERREYLQTIIDASMRMSELIQGLLEYAKVSTEGQASDERVDVGDVLSVVERNLSAQIHESGAKIIRGGLPELKASRLQLTRLIQNLIGNSIKYRSSGRPCQIHLTAERTGQNWMISVQDNGIGFSPEYKEQIFGVFKRLERSYPGSGVGLAICRRIVELNGGRIWAEGAPGEGAKFCFTWRDSNGEAPRPVEEVPAARQRRS